ncbi:hypothetical protein ACFFGT_00080 [Mucilaginibacter angelicae]|uniref:SLH domain-containing protein n=1 Tax=Mucilaginibacter angelicae TaxID=869718 RepID=A0ABV6KZW4_9SPHI
MKYCLITLISFIILLNNSYAQSPSGAIDSLIKYGVITSKERPVLERELKDRGHFSNQVAILAGLESIMLQKKFHVNPHKTGIMISYSGNYPKKTQRDSANRSLNLLLTKINKAGLLTNRVYNYTRESIDSSRFMVELQLIGALAEMSARLELLAPQRLLPIAEQLHKNGIVNDSSFLRLENDIRERKIESISQLSEYWQLSKTINIDKYPNDLHLLLEQIHRDIASILPGLNFTDFSYTETPDTSLSIGKIPATRFKISFNCNGRVYKHTFVSLFYKNREGKIHFSNIELGVFHRIFNKVLADQQSPLRLNSVIFSRPYVADNDSQYTTTIALRGEQAEVFMTDPTLSYMIVGMENYDNTLTSAKIDSTIATWKKIGLFAHLTKAQIDTATDNAIADDWFSMNRLLTNFPGIIYRSDSAWMDPRHPYANLLKHLGRITHGVFTPTNISQKKVKGNTELKYSYRGKVHSHIFNMANGWLDTKFPKLLKSLSMENNLPGKFYQLDFDDVIYLTQQQYDYIVKNNLLEIAEVTSGKIKQRH